MDSILVFEQLNNVVNIILQNKYNNITSTTLDGNSYTFSIMRINEIICQMVIIKTTETVATGKTRCSHKQEVNVPTIKILWLETKEAYRNHNLGMLLMYYGILRLKLYDANIQYVMVDDVSDNSCLINKNIYNKFGFIFQGQVALNLTKHNCVILYGPEKQLEINDAFMERLKKNILHFNLCTNQI
jgi:hypothetical protein